MLEFHENIFPIQPGYVSPTMNSLASVFITSSKFIFISSGEHPVSMDFCTFFKLVCFFLFKVIEVQSITFFSIRTFSKLLDLFLENNYLINYQMTCLIFQFFKSYLLFHYDEFNRHFTILSKNWNQNYRYVVLKQYFLIESFIFNNLYSWALKEELSLLLVINGLIFCAFLSTLSFFLNMT